MTDELEQDLFALKAWLNDAWQRVSDPMITPYERREMRNYMKEAEQALRLGMRRITERREGKREADKMAAANRLPNFRILQLDI